METIKKSKLCGKHIRKTTKKKIKPKYKCPVQKKHINRFQQPVPYLEHVFKDEFPSSFFSLGIYDSFLKEKQVSLFSFTSSLLFPEQYNILKTSKKALINFMYDISFGALPIQRSTTTICYPYWSKPHWSGALKRSPQKVWWTERKLWRWLVSEKEETWELHAIQSCIPAVC